MRFSRELLQRVRLSGRRIVDTAGLNLSRRRQSSAITNVHNCIHGLVQARLLPLAISDRSASMLHHASGGVFDAEGEFVQNAQIIRHGSYYFDALPYPSYPNRYIDIAIYGGVIFDHYGHFMLESLCRIDHWIDEYKSSPILFLCPPGISLRTYQLEVFRLRGILSRVIIVREPYRVGFLVVPPASLIYMHKIEKNFLDTFRKIASNVPGKDLGRVYLSRKGLKSAETFPEEELEDIFRKDGWSILKPQDLDYVEQIAIFKGGRIFAGLTGSALHNLVYSAEGVCVTYINRFREPVNTFKMLDQLIGVQGSYIEGYLACPPEPIDASGPFFIDIESIYSSLVLSGAIAKSTPKGFDDTTVLQYETSYKAAAFARLAEHSRWNGDESKQSSALNEGLALSPEHPSLLYEAAHLKLTQRNLVGALVDAERGLTAAPRETRLLRLIISICGLIEDHPKRLSTCRALMRLQPGDRESQALIVDILYEYNLHEECARHFNGMRVCEIGPDTLCKLSKCLISIGASDEAAAVAKRAVFSSPDDVDLRRHLALCLRLAGLEDRSVIESMIAQRVRSEICNKRS